MTVSRGQFLKLCGGTLIAGHLDPTSLVANADRRAIGATAPTLPRPCSAGAAEFQSHLGSTFVVGSHDRPIRVRLANVIEWSRDPQLEQFSVVFHTLGDAALSEGTQAFRHPVLGQFDLYIAPIGVKTNPQTMFEACFSRHG